MLFWTVLFRTKSCLFYDHILWLIRPTMPLRHRRSALRLFGSYRWRGTKGAPWRRMTRENPSVDFLGYWRTAMQFSKPLSRASLRFLLFGKYDKNSLDFFRIAEDPVFCMLLTRPPWLDIAWQERIKCHCRA